MVWAQGLMKMYSKCKLKLPVCDGLTEANGSASKLAEDLSALWLLAGTIDISTCGYLHETI